jgi:hypothetical protein
MGPQCSHIARKRSIRYCRRACLANIAGEAAIRRSYVGLEVIGELAETLEVGPAELMKVQSRRRS